MGPLLVVGRHGLLSLGHRGDGRWLIWGQSQINHGFVIWTVIDCQPWVWRQRCRVEGERERESREMLRQRRNGDEKDKEEKKVGPTEKKII